MAAKINYEKEEIKIGSGLHVKMFESMVKARLFEERQLQLYHEGKIGGYLHPGIGNEAAYAGIVFALEDDDIIYPTHRGYGIFVMRGVDMGKVLAELMCKKDGCCNGQGGSCHMAAPQVRQIQGILGAQFPLSVGEALAVKLLDEKKVVLCAFGDGCANNGTFHESLNMASIWKLPVVFVCINNLYAVSLSFDRSTSVKSNALRARGYSMPGYDIDGTDYESVYKAVKKAANRARSGEGPSLIEVKTTRVRGHHTGDQGSYRTKEELEKVKRNDLIKKAIRKLTKLNILDSKKINKIYQKIEGDIDNAVIYANNSPLPSVDEFIEYCKQSLK